MNIILTDVDGVLVDWVSAFQAWMAEHGYTENPDNGHMYALSGRYGITKEEVTKLIATFNESCYIEHLPPLGDAIHYVKKLHERHGYVFHAITSLSDNPFAIALRKRNLDALFGPSVFQQVTCLPVGADKYDALSKYAGTGYWWVEDKLENAMDGLTHGLKSIIYDQPYNKVELDPLTKTEPLNRCQSWQDIYYEVTQE